MLDGEGTVEGIYHIFSFHRVQHHECPDGEDCEPYQRLVAGKCRIIREFPLLQQTIVDKGNLKQGFCA